MRDFSILKIFNSYKIAEIKERNKIKTTKKVENYSKMIFDLQNIILIFIIIVIIVLPIIVYCFQSTQIVQQTLKTQTQKTVQNIYI